jgi:hypothetical protein
MLAVYSEAGVANCSGQVAAGKCVVWRRDLPASDDNQATVTAILTPYKGVRI